MKKIIKWIIALMIIGILIMNPASGYYHKSQIFVQKKCVCKRPVFSYRSCITDCCDVCMRYPRPRPVLRYYWDPVTSRLYPGLTTTTRVH